MVLFRIDPNTVSYPDLLSLAYSGGHCRSATTTQSQSVTHERLNQTNVDPTIHAVLFDYAEMALPLLDR